jgi:hypothetical protein
MGKLTVASSIPDILTIEELENLIATTPPNSPSVIRTVTPQVAQHIVDKWNKLNRSTVSRKIRQYAEAMKAGQWRLNGETCIFSRKRMMNGQNRMYACILAGVPFRTHLVFGVEDDIFDSMDAGKSRDHADVLKTLGAKDPKTMAVAVRWIAWITANKANIRKPAYTPQETGELYRRFKRAEDFTEDAKKIAGINLQSPGVVCAFLYCFDMIDSALAADIAEAWKTPKRSDEFIHLSTMDTAIAELRKAGMKGSDLFQTTRAAMIINTWKAVQHFRETGSMRGVTIRWDASKAFPLLFPVQPVAKLIKKQGSKK